MSKQNPNSKPDAFPAEIDWSKVRKSVDPDTGARERHERDIAKLDRMSRRGEK